MQLKIGPKIDITFDKEDAKIAVPILLYCMISALKIFDNRTASIFIVTYFLVLFSIDRLTIIIKLSFGFLKKYFFFKCPNCKSKKLILQGYQGYHSDEQHAHYLCLSCNQTSIQTENGLHFSKG